MNKEVTNVDWDSKEKREQFGRTFNSLIINFSDGKIPDKDKVKELALLSKYIVECCWNIFPNNISEKAKTNDDLPF